MVCDEMMQVNRMKRELLTLDVTRLHKSLFHVSRKRGHDRSVYMNDGHEREMFVVEERGSKLDVGMDCIEWNQIEEAGHTPVGHPLCGGHFQECRRWS